MVRLTFLFVGSLFIFIVFSQSISLLLLLAHISIDEEDQEMIEMHVFAQPPAEQGTLYLIYVLFQFLFVTLPVFQLNPNQKSKRLSEVLRVKTSINSCDQKMIFLWPENCLNWIIMMVKALIRCMLPCVTKHYNSQINIAS